MDHRDTRPARREFLREAALGTFVAQRTLSARAADASARMQVAVVGLGGMGRSHLKYLLARTDVDVAWLCDVDAERLATADNETRAARGSAAKTTSDLRELLADEAVVAVFIATPDHWHAPAAILALNAGKHVYVEKPCCHNVREGQWMAEAVARTGKVLQVGTQSRSTAFVREAIERVLAGEIGEVRVAKAWNSQQRRDIGHTKASAPPATLDFDRWIGPATMVPYRTNLLHGVWRWWYDFGCGDIGNDGVHDIDVALWGLGVDTHPQRITCLGGKYHFDDDQQFPDTQYVVCEYPAAGAPPQGNAVGTRQLIFEQRIWSPYPQEGYDNGAAFYGTKGVLILGHSRGWRLYGPRNELILERTGASDLAAHHEDFFQSIREPGRAPHADIQAGLRAAVVVHLANISARVGRTLRFDPERLEIVGDEEAGRMLQRNYRKDHWAVPGSV